MSGDIVFLFFKKDDLDSPGLGIVNNLPTVNQINFQNIFFNRMVKFG